ncbi:MAG TPA: ABC transporter ATP-binding protein, partial [Luteibacter sp.]|nr:ABC transporter ATP-binding protein [Luteibacter sp.]
RNIAIIDQGRIVQNTTMKSLLATLDVETFVLDVSNVPAALPTLPGVVLRTVDDHTIEAEMSRAHDLNSLFAALSSHGVTVTSMRNKANRLEELFVRLVEHGRENAA